MPFDRKVYFDAVREELFGGVMNQPQVDGQNAILQAWEMFADEQDIRWLAYMLATTYHETSMEMQPIAEYGKGEGHEYGEKDPETAQTYYGRGFVQVTWRENYEKTDRELGLDQDRSTVWWADNMLNPFIAGGAMFLGMRDGWFRSDEDGRQTLARYFSNHHDDAYNAREIINGDKAITPDWSDGLSIGYLIEGYHIKFLDALNQAELLI